MMSGFYAILFITLYNGYDLGGNSDDANTRSFYYINDLISGMAAMMHSNYETFGPINLVNNKEISVLELVKFFWSLSSLKVKFYLTLFRRVIRNNDSLILKKLKKLGWQPEAKFQDS